MTSWFKKKFLNFLHSDFEFSKICFSRVAPDSPVCTLNSQPFSTKTSIISTLKIRLIEDNADLLCPFILNLFFIKSRHFLSKSAKKERKTKENAKKYRFEQNAVTLYICISYITFSLFVVNNRPSDAKNRLPRFWAKNVHCDRTFQKSNYFTKK